MMLFSIYVWVDDYCSMGDGLPFSVAPDKLLSPQDVLSYVRDHYEGTAFDLTKGLAAGPYGDPDRYDLSASLDGTVRLVLTIL
jgi:dipeptidase